jgi:hypothetical protein
MQAGKVAAACGSVDGMATDSAHRSVRLARIENSRYTVINERGGKIAFPAGEQGDQARKLLPDAVRKSHDRLCTVSRTVELGTPIATRID